MAALTELERNPVALVVDDGDGKHNISAERGKAGKVWLTCQCHQSVADGWCRHRLDLLCSRFDAAPEADATTRRAFLQIVTGTPLGEAGLNLDRSLKAFDACLTAFDEGRPTPVVGEDLGKFTDLVSDLAACASELEDALGTMRRLLER
ncbi:MAG: hypothetical protein ABI399_11150 [Bauldia sp.]